MNEKSAIERKLSQKRSDQLANENDWIPTLTLGVGSACFIPSRHSQDA